MLASITYVYRYSSNVSAAATSLTVYDFDNDTFSCSSGNAANETKVVGDYTFDIYVSRRSFKCPYNGKIYYATKSVTPSGSSITTFTNEVDYTANSTYTLPSFLDLQLLLAFVKT